MFPGPARSLGKTLCSIEQAIIKPLTQQGFDVHVMVATSKDDPQKNDYLRLRDLTEVKSFAMREHAMPLDRSSEHPEDCLQQLKDKYDKVITKHWGIAYVNELLGKWYFRQSVCRMAMDSSLSRDSWGIMLRPDNVFVSRIPVVRSLRQDYLYVPSFHSHKGNNDRFAMGQLPLLARAVNLYNDWCHFNATHQLPYKVKGLQSEELFQLNMNMHHLKVQKIAFYFFRLRYGDSDLFDLERDIRSYPLETNPTKHKDLVRRGKLAIDMCR